MNKQIRIAAVALVSMLAGCGDGADDELVSVTVTGLANVRNAPAAEGTRVLETLSVGTQLTGRWVESDANASKQWFAYERDGETVYVWGRNLSEQSDVQIASAEDDNQPVAQSEISRPASLTLPRKAFACGGNGYRNGRIVFDPEVNKVYLASTSGRKDGTGAKWQSSFIRKDGDNWYFLFQGTLDDPSQEVYFDPKRLISRENSNYEPGGREKADACYARIEKVKSECATAGDIDKCMEIRDRTAWAANFSGSCSITAPRWQDFQCDDITHDYASTLQQVRSFPLFDF